MEKQDLEKFKDEIIHEFGIIAEDIKSDIKLVAEQVGNNTEKIDELTVKVDSNTEKIEELTVRVDVNTEKIEELTTVVNSHTEKINDLQVGMRDIQETLDVMKLDIEFIKHDLKQKVNRDEFAALEHRLSMLETKFAQRA